LKVDYLQSQFVERPLIVTTRKNLALIIKSIIMHPKKIWANYAVSDLDRTTKFYTASGFKQNGKPNNELASFLFGDGNFIIHFFLKDILKRNIQGEIADLQNGNEIIFTLSAQSIDEVNACAQEIEDAGGKLITRPDAFGDGYYGFIFADPDGHRFNVFYMEGL
jgi:predicted lactoylglutathione lyase